MYSSSRLLLITLLFFSIKGLAQKSVDIDSLPAGYNLSASFYSVSGEPRVTSRFTRITEGSPYLIGVWGKTTIKLQDGNIHSGIISRINLLDNEIHYLKNNQEFILERPVKEIAIEDTSSGFHYLFRTGYLQLPSISENTLLQVMSEGKATLLKHHRKLITETKPYGSATTEQVIRNADAFYMVQNQSLIKVKNNRNELLKLLQDKSKELEDYIRREKLQFRNEYDLVNLFVHYNSLQSK